MHVTAGLANVDSVSGNNSVATIDQVSEGH